MLGVSLAGAEAVHPEQIPPRGRLRFPGMRHLVGVGPEGEVALEAARGGGVVEGVLVAAPQVPLPGGVAHAVESPNTDHAVCGHPVSKVLDQGFEDFVGLEHCAACELALAEEI